MIFGGTQYLATDLWLFGNEVSFTEEHDSLPRVNLTPFTSRAHAAIAVVTRIWRNLWRTCRSRWLKCAENWRPSTRRKEPIRNCRWSCCLSLGQFLVKHRPQIGQLCLDEGQHIALDSVQMVLISWEKRLKICSVDVRRTLEYVMKHYANQKDKNSGESGDQPVSVAMIKTTRTKSLVPSRTAPFWEESDTSWYIENQAYQLMNHSVTYSKATKAPTTDQYMAHFCNSDSEMGRFDRVLKVV